MLGHCKVDTCIDTVNRLVFFLPCTFTVIIQIYNSTVLRRDTYLNFSKGHCCPAQHLRTRSMGGSYLHD